MKWSAILTLVCLLGISGMVFAAADPSTGMVDNGISSILPAVAIPDGFNPEAARAAMKQARLNGDAEKAAELSRQLNAWWQQNNPVNNNPVSTGTYTNSNPGPAIPGESRRPESGPTPFWGTDSRISPLDYVYGTKVASLSNGELYSIAVYYDGAAYHGMVNRSTDNGLSWGVYWDNTFTGYEIIDPYIIVVQDTIIESYVLYQTSNSTYRTWFRVCLPGASDNCIYYGSPTGSFNAIQYSNLRVCSDNAAYVNNEYLYATWNNRFGGTPPDSTHVVFARSNELNVSSWEIPPTRITYSNGGAYFTGDRIAFGSGSADHLWIACWLHPNLYPGTFDRCICGWLSDDYGSSWNTTVYITPYTDDLDQSGPEIAGAHFNLNWACLYQQADTSTGLNQDVNIATSIDDGGTWSMATWIVPYTEFLPAIHVDDASTAFYAAVRQDVTSGNEQAKYKVAPITDPTSWTESVRVNDNVSNLSIAYGPSITRNRGTGDAVIAWTDYAGYVYSIWMDAESWVGIEEGSDTKPLAKLALNISPNPNRGVAHLNYTVRTNGNVRVAVYDATGRLVKNLVNDTRKAGTYTAQLNVNLPNGVYFVRMDTPDGSIAKTVTVVK